MAPKSSSRPAEPQRPGLDDIEGYLLDEDFEDGDPFRSPSPGTGSNKRKEPTGLGIDEEVEVKKRAIVPRVKLDDTRLLSDRGIPELRRRAKHLKLKGKGHEFSDAARLLSFYQLWLDDLFPKARFLDALAMVEKAGHKANVRRQRMEWINEGKPRPTVDDEEEQGTQGRASLPDVEPARNTHSLEMAGQAPRRANTPPADNLFGDDDLYSATPRGALRRGNGAAPDDELDALMAQEEAHSQSRNNSATRVRKPIDSIFGDGKTMQAPEEPDQDELDALMAQEEAHSQSRNNSATRVRKPIDSIFGDGKTMQAPEEPDQDELDALMAQEEAEALPERQGGGQKPRAEPGSIFGDGRSNAAQNQNEKDGMDDLDRLIGGEETGDRTAEPPEPATVAEEGGDAGSADFADEEEAMAEMEGLW